MFEGLVRQLILGYLGQYIKDIQTEQLKITLWNEEVLLENVELILEAFDYLRLPLALKRGLIGKLSIKIPWKKLGWDPLIIILEDVYICVCQRDDKDWCSDAVERREFASKKAQLAAAELAKLSRRVCDVQTGKSFTSYITAKILDSIQVSIRNVHVLYRDTSTEGGKIFFGLKFSSLTIMKQSSIGSSVAKVKGGQVSKIIEVKGLELYCNSSKETYDSCLESKVDSQKHESEKLEASKHSSMLAPLNVLISLSVNRSGKLLNDTPQYTINVEFAGMAISMDDVQLRHIMSLCDHMSLCRIREEYGRYRPWWCPLEKRLKGWKRAWWHYAQESVLFDVRRKLRRTSWKYFGERVSSRRKYVNLYKSKLRSLRNDQIIQEDIRHELEEMEKQTELDDILNYRSIAECELEDFLVNSSSSHGSNGVIADKSVEDDQPSSKTRGWLNWLSYGMLGAGGTDDSSQFSGVISDDVIKDIYEATKFHPAPVVNGNLSMVNEVYVSSVKVNITEVCTTLRSMELGQAIADLVLEGISIEGKVWEKSATVFVLVNCAQMLNPFNSQVVLLTKKVNSEVGALEKQQPSVNIKVDLSSPTSVNNLSVKVTVNPVELYCDSEFLKNITKIFSILKHCSFQHRRILQSLNGIGDLKTRLLSKIGYILSSHTKIVWDIQIFNLGLILPWENATLEAYKIVLGTESVSFTSGTGTNHFHSHGEEHLRLLKGFMRPGFGSIEADLSGFHLQDLYDYFEIQITGTDMKLLSPSAVVPLLEKFDASSCLASCILPDEPVLKALEIFIQVSSVLAYFPVVSYGGVILGLVEQFKVLHSLSHSADSVFLKSNGMEFPMDLWWLSVKASLDSFYLLVDLDCDASDGYTLKLFFQLLDIRYDQRDFQMCLASVKACSISAKSEKDDCGINILCSTGIQGVESASSHDMGYLHDQNGHLGDKSSMVDGCIALRYEASGNVGKCVISACDLDIHCYPFLFGRFIGFFNKIAVSGGSNIEDLEPIMKDENVLTSHNLKPEHGSHSNTHAIVSHDPVQISYSPSREVDDLRNLCNMKTIADDTGPEISKSFYLEDPKKVPVGVTVTEETEILSVPHMSYELDTDSTLNNSCNSGLLPINLNLVGVTVYFHDSSCMIATLMMPFAKLLISISADILDVMCSTEGMSLSSSWWSQAFHSFLWGPLSSDFSPVLNFHLKKRNTGLKESLLELCFNIQKVFCMLPSEILAMIIGYFSLPDWSSTAKECSTDDVSCEKAITIVYRFEIVDCDLLTPANIECSEFLKFNISRLCILFSGNSDWSFMRKDIPSLCCIGAGKLADRNGCLDFYGWDLSITLLSLENNKDNGYRTTTLIAPLTADVWVIIPHDTEFSGFTLYPMCIMAMIKDCQLNVEDLYAVAGIKALTYAIDQFSLVGIESKCFTCDVPHFLLMKKQVFETDALLPKPSNLSLTEMRFCVRSLSLRLHRMKKDSVYSELIAEAEMHFVCSMSLINDKPYFLDVSFSYLTLFSYPSCVVLAKCSCPGSDSSVLDFILSTSDTDENCVVLSIPCLDMWLYWFDWSEFLDLLHSCSERLSKEFISGTLAETVPCSPDGTGNYAVVGDSNHDTSANASQSSGFSTLMFENVGLAVHFPAHACTEKFNVFFSPLACDKQPLNNQFSGFCGNPKYFFTVTLKSRSIDVAVKGKVVKVAISCESLCGTLKLIWEDYSQTWPFFKVSKIHLEAEIVNEIRNLFLKMLVQCAILELSLSNQLFYLPYFTWFIKSEETPSQFNIKRMDFKVQLQKFSLLLTDWKQSSSGPLLEVPMRNFIFSSSINDDETEGSIACELEVNYYNIDKVLWEPFVEPWKFVITMIRKHDEKSLFNSAIMTDIKLDSKANLNLNLNESLIEVIWRTFEMIKDSQDLMKITGRQVFANSSIINNPETRRYAPYMLQNLTAIPLVFYVCLGDDEFDVSPSKGVLEPGSSTLVYINESPEKLLFRYRPIQSSDRLSDKQLLEAAHRYVTFQLEGTSTPSAPISMDLVGRRYFDVDFSKSSHLEVYGETDTIKNTIEAGSGTDAVGGLVIPVVIDVSVQHYTKLMRLYSTVVIFNATSVPLEVRFDIPFGVSPKILGPIYPGQEFPLPLHLAESGCIRWRPLGESYLWSEYYNISSIISRDVRIGVFRSFVCYPSHPSYEAFRCCISVQDQSLPSIGRLRRVIGVSTDQQSLKCHSQSLGNLEMPKNRNIYQVMLTSPFALRNYLMKSISLTLDVAGVTRTAFLSEVETSLFHIDTSHDLSITFKMHGFRPSMMKFPRAESFGAIAKFNGTKFSLLEIVRFDSEFSEGPLYVTMEKIMDAFTGSREIIISVPFLLYNCTGFSLALSNSLDKTKGYNCIPSCYNSDEYNALVKKKDGLCLISPTQDLPATDATSETRLNVPDFVGSCSQKVNACLFSPDPNSYSGEIIVKLSRYLPSVREGFSKCSWSLPFALVPPTGSTGVLVPQSSSTSGHVISVCAVTAPFYGRTKIITFQPRYVIANSCIERICYKQKGTGYHFILEPGEHSHIQWMDTTRELLLSVRFDKPGWEWSGCFLPEQLGDAQVKMRNYMTAAISMIRVEVRSADVTLEEEKIVGSSSGNSGTNLVILSDDDTGFMPYRIDNISRERLRIYQPKCESFETVIHPYTSSPYAWDEPCYSHALIIEVPGERILGSFAIDNPSVDAYVHLSANSEKPERNLHISIHSEGAIKVLSIIDSSYHVLNELKSLAITQLKDNSKTQKYESFLLYKERLSFNIPFLGVSLMNSSPEELLFAFAKNTTASFVQSLEQQQFSLQIASLQIDNQLCTTPYPVILSFNHGNKNNVVRSKDNIPNLIGKTITNFNTPALSLAISQWRTNDTSLVSFESISLRITDLYLEIEQEIVLRLFEFSKNAYSRLQSRVFQRIDSSQYPLFPNLDLAGETPGNLQYFVSWDEKYSTFTRSTLINKKYTSRLQPQMVPIGAPWQKIHLSAQKHKKVYVENFDIAPIKLTLSFSSNPLMLRHGVLTSGESLIHRGLMAFADIEGAKIQFKHLVLSHQIASWESIQEILVSYYTHQFLHEMYKVFGSAGVIGNPMGFARSLGLGIKDFFSLPIWSVFQNPAGLITGMAEGTTSLLSNTVYAISDATSQFSKAAHKGIVALTFDDQTVTLVEKQQKGIHTHNKGVINELLQGLTGVLQSPIEGAERHGLPGVLSGIAVGVTGLVARPAASLLEVTGKTAQSIRNRSRIHQMGYRYYRFRLPRPLSRELPLKPYSWEEAIGKHALSQWEGETLVTCKALKECGQYVMITERLIIVVSCASLVDLNKPKFEGVPPDPLWVMESEIRLDSILLSDNDGNVVHIVGSGSDAAFRHNQHQLKSGNRPKGKLWKNFHTPLPLLQTNLEFNSPGEADEFLKVLMSMIEMGKERGWNSLHVLHQSNIK